MKPEAQEALGRLKDRLKDRKITHERDGQFMTTSMATVAAADIIALCAELPAHPRTDALKAGSQNALDATKLPDQVVHIQLIDLDHLVKQVELPSASAKHAPFKPAE